MGNVHIISGRRGLGFVLAVATTILWATASVSLAVVVREMDAFTVSFYRFLLSLVLLGPFILRRYGPPRREQLRGKVPLLLLAAAAGLAANYALFMLGLQIMLPGATVVLIQLAPAFLLIGGVVIFREKYSLRQLLGFLVLLGGLGLFFHDKIGLLRAAGGAYRAGALFVVASAAAWAAYALCQKQLLNTFSSGAVMLLIYTGAALCFLPFSHLGSILHMTTVPLVLLLYTGLNTLAAYGAFAESLEHLEASRVSAVIATGPLWTIACIKLVNLLFPGLLPPEPIDRLSLLGACLVVIGSMINSLAGIGKKE